MWEKIDMWGILKWLNIYATEIPEEKENEVKAIFEEVIVENLFKNDERYQPRGSRNSENSKQEK